MEPVSRMYVDVYFGETSKQDVSKRGAECIQFNSLRPRKNGRLSADDIFKRIVLNKNVILSIQISLKFVPGCPIDNK